MNIDQIHDKLTRAEAKYLQAKGAIRRDKKELRKAKENLKSAEEAQEIIQNVAQTVQQQAHEQIAGIVTRCLNAVFDEPYEFRIVFEKRRGKTEADLAFYRGGNRFKPLKGSGGGVVEVASFGLRLAAILFARPKQRRILILDEPFKNVNGVEYQHRVAALLQSLSEEMNVQFILVSDDEWLKIGKVIEV